MPRLSCRGPFLYCSLLLCVLSPSPVLEPPHSRTGPLWFTFMMEEEDSWSLRGSSQLITLISAIGAALLWLWSVVPSSDIARSGTNNGFRHLIMCLPISSKSDSSNMEFMKTFSVDDGCGSRELALLASSRSDRSSYTDDEELGCCRCRSSDGLSSFWISLNSDKTLVLIQLLKKPTRKRTKPHHRERRSRRRVDDVLVIVTVVIMLLLLDQLIRSTSLIISSSPHNNSILKDSMGRPIKLPSVIRCESLKNVKVEPSLRVSNSESPQLVVVVVPSSENIDDKTISAFDANCGPLPLPSTGILSSDDEDEEDPNPRGHPIRVKTESTLEETTTEFPASTTDAWSSDTPSCSAIFVFCRRLSLEHELDDAPSPTQGNELSQAYENLDHHNLYSIITLAVVGKLCCLFSKNSMLIMLI